MAGPSKEWLEGTITISREEFSNIISDNIAAAMMATAIATQGDQAAIEKIKGLLMRYSAAVAMDVFNDHADEDTLEIG